MPVLTRLIVAAPQLRGSLQNLPVGLRKVNIPKADSLTRARAVPWNFVISHPFFTSSSCVSKLPTSQIRMTRSSSRSGTTTIDSDQNSVLKVKRELKRDLDAHCILGIEPRGAPLKKVKREDDTTTPLNSSPEIIPLPPLAIKAEETDSHPQHSDFSPQKFASSDLKVNPKAELSEATNVPDAIVSTRRRRSRRTEAADVGPDHCNGSTPALPAESKGRGRSKSVASAIRTPSSSLYTGNVPSFRKQEDEDPDADFAALQSALVTDIDPANLATELSGVFDVIKATPAKTAVVIKRVPSGKPFPNHARPYPEECREVTRRLARLHGWHIEEHRACPTLEPDEVLDTLPSTDSGAGLAERGYDSKAESVVAIRMPSGSAGGVVVAIKEEQGAVVEKVKAGWAKFGVLDSLVRTILSQNTTDKNASRAYAALKTRFPLWEEVHAADPADLESAIRCGGLAEIKGKRIKEILATLQSEKGALCLEYLHEMSTDQIKAELGRFKGVGPKTVFRITKSLGWVPPTADRERTYLHLNDRIPDDCKYALHCLLVTHGKHCPNCAKKWAQRAPVGPCPLVNWGKEHLKFGRGGGSLGVGEGLLTLEG